MSDRILLSLIIGAAALALVIAIPIATHHDNPVAVVVPNQPVVQQSPAKPLTEAPTILPLAPKEQPKSIVQTPKVEQPLVNTNGVSVKVLDTYISSIKIPRQVWSDNSPYPRIAWDTAESCMCFLVLITNDSDKTAWYVTWHGSVSDYKLKNRGKGEGAYIADKQCISGYDESVATSDLSKSAWDTILGAKDKIHDFSSCFDATGLNSMNDMVNMGFKSIGFFKDSIPPKMSELDILMFSEPSKDADMVLHLPAANLGGDGTIEIKIGKDDVRYRTGRWIDGRMREAQSKGTHKVEVTP